MKETNNGHTISLGTYILSDIIDVFFYTLVFTIISVVFTGASDNLPDTLAWIPITLYVVVFHCYMYWTPGMKVFKYKFVDAKNLDKKPATWKMILHWGCSFFFKFSLIFGLVALYTFKKESGFYWDRWFGIKIVKV